MHILRRLLSQVRRKQVMDYDSQIIREVTSVILLYRIDLGMFHLG